MGSVSTSPWIFECLVAVVVSWLLKVLFTRKKNLPPGPPSLPVIGNFHLIGRPPHQSLAQMAEKYGPLMSLRLGQKLCIVATSPRTAMEFLKYQDANFNPRPSLRATELIWPEDIAFSEITPSSRQAKRIFDAMLTSSKQLEKSHHLRVNEIFGMLSAIPKDGTFVLRSHLDFLMFNIISRMTYSKTSTGANTESSGDLKLARELKSITEELSLVFGAVNLRDFIPIFKWLDLQGLEKRMKKVRIRMESLLAKVIDERVELRKKKMPEGNQREKDLIDGFLDYMEEKNDSEISYDLMKGTVWNTFAAGIETTSSAMEWILAEACRKPKVLQKAQAEVDAVVGQTRRVQESDIPELKYIQAIVKEGFRLHPPAPLLLPHQSKKPCKAFGYDLPANTRLLVNVWAIGRDPKIWSNPLEFNPERFLDGGQDAAIDFQGLNFELLPFSAGRRVCPGKGLATIVLQTIIANLLHSFSWDVEEIDMSEGEGLALPMAVPFTAHVKARLPFHLYQ